MKKVITIILMLVLMVTVYIAGYQEAKLIYESELEKAVHQYEELNMKGTASNPDFYYGEAYILNQEKIINDVIVITWRVNYSLNHCFLTYSSDYLDEDCPYLLTIDSNKTKDISDDEIAVIWQGI
jgi:hypothetical protein